MWYVQQLQYLIERQNDTIALLRAELELCHSGIVSRGGGDASFSVHGDQVLNSLAGSVSQRVAGLDSQYKRLASSFGDAVQSSLDALRRPAFYPTGIIR